MNPATFLICATWNRPDRPDCVAGDECSLHLAAATDHIGRRFTSHNVVSTADRVLATHKGVGG